MAENPSTPEAVLRGLLLAAFSPVNDDVAQSVLKNANVTVGILDLILSCKRFSASTALLALAKRHEAKGETEQPGNKEKGELR